MHASGVAGDDDGVGSEVDLEGLVEPGQRCAGPRLCIGTTSRIGTVVIGGGHQRFTEGYVEMDRARVGATHAGGRGQRTACRRAPVGVERRKARRGGVCHAEADGRTHLGTEVTELFECLVSAGAEEFVGTIRREDDQRNARVVGLNHGWAEVGHSAAGRHRHAYGCGGAVGKSHR